MTPRLDAFAARLGDILARTKWVLLSRNGVGAVLVIAAVGGVLGVGVLHRSSTDTESEVRAASVLLRHDFVRGVSQLDDTWLRGYEGTDAGGLTGRITKAVAAGTCWGFDVRVPGEWLTTGTGQVSIGEVREYPQAACETEPARPTP
jgi:hypothetical protein